MNNLKDILLSRYHTTSRNYTVFGTFCYGSQNYDLATPQSDLDTRTIILPSLRAVALNHEPISTTLTQDADGLNDLKDIRLMFKTFLKQNTCFLEILFTKHLYINPEYAAEFKILHSMREELARFSHHTAVNAMVGMMLEKQHALCKPYPSKVDLIETHGYDAKQLTHIIRLSEVFDKYIAGEPYEQCLITSKRDFLLAVKNYKYTLDDAIAIADKYCSEYRARKDAFIHSTLPNINQAVSSELDELLYEIFKKHLTN